MNALILIIFATTFAASVQAQNTRSFVSGIGDDNNDCLRATPCKTFAGAIAKTGINGEINCVDNDGYGAVTITKSITIDCEDTQGAILGSGTSGVIVNLGPASPADPKRIVRLRGLSINGQGTGSRGIWAVTGNGAPTTIHVDQVVIAGFSEGILFNSDGGELIVRNSTIEDCSVRGVTVDSGVAFQLVFATLEGSNFVHNAEGIRVETSAFVTAANCNISSNNADGAIISTPDSTLSDLNLYNCMIAGNGQSGVSANSSTSPPVVRLSGNHIVNNSKGVFNNATVLSRGNNTISGNGVDIDGPPFGVIPSL